ncbi:hypothetical protein ACFE04_027559 [Oxalis oulophora]
MSSASSSSSSSITERRGIPTAEFVEDVQSYLTQYVAASTLQYSNGQGETMEMVTMADVSSPSSNIATSEHLLDSNSPQTSLLHVRVRSNISSIQFIPVTTLLRVRVRSNILDLICFVFVPLISRGLG